MIVLRAAIAQLLRLLRFARLLLVPICIGLVAAQPFLFDARTPRGADVLLHTYRLVALQDLVQHGVWYSPWFPNLAFGYGYPIFQYYAPFTQYVALLLTGLGLTPAQAISVSMALALVLAAVGATLWLRDVWHEQAAWVGAAAFACAPYLLYNAYERAALAELMAMALIPLVLFLLRRATLRQSNAYAVAGAGVYAAHVLSHNITALLLAPIVLVYGVLLIVVDTLPINLTKSRWLAWFRRLRPLALMFGLGLGLSAFFWLPALLERDLSQLERALSSAYDYRNYFLNLDTLLAGPHAIDPYLVNATVTPSLSWVGILLALLGCIVTLRAGRNRAEGVFALGVAVVLVGLTLPASLPIWQALPLLHFVLYPFRLLGLASLFLAGLTAAAFQSTLLNRSGLALGCVLAIVLYGWTWQLPKHYESNLPQSAQDIAVAERTLGIVGTTSIGEYLPTAVQQLPTNDALRQHRLQPNSLPPGAQLLAEVNEPLRFRVQVNSPINFRAIFSQFYFLGWQATVDGTAVTITPTVPAGLMSIDVPAGTHTLELAFRTTPLRGLAAGVSVISLLICITLWTRNVRKSRAREWTTALSSVVHRPSPILPILLLAALLAIKTLWIDRSDNPWRHTRLQQGYVQDSAIVGLVRFADQLVLVGADPPIYDSRENTVTLDLFWQKARADARDLSIVTRLIDASGETLLLHDALHPDGIYPVSRWEMDQYASDRHRLTVPSATPPGRYQLQVGVYELGRPAARLPIADAGVLARAGNEVVLGSVQITRALNSSTLITPSNYLNVQVNDAVALIGVDMPLRQIRVGELLPLNLYWHAIAPGSEILRACFYVRYVAQEHSLACHDLVPGFSSDQWRTGDVWRGVQRVKLPPTLVSGDVEFGITVAGQRVVLGPLKIDAPTRSMQAPRDMRAQPESIAAWVALAGFGMPTDIQAGQTLTVNLVWRSTGETNDKYKVTLQLLNENGERVAGHDDTPAQGTHPSSTWIAGEYIEDAHPLKIPTDLPLGKYRVAVGLYEEFTGQPLKLADERTLIVLDQVVLIKVP